MPDMPEQGSPTDVDNHPSNNMPTPTESYWGESLANRLTGRTTGERAFYNQTRAGLYNSDTPPDEASPIGGLGQSLKSRRESQAYESQAISAAVPRRKN
jgi:hypothetical protein